MARSKKDGKHKGGHKLRKWRRLEFRRVEARARVKEEIVKEYEEETEALQKELEQDFDEFEREYYEDFLAYEYYSDIEEHHYDDYSDGWDEEWDHHSDLYIYPPDDPEPQFDVFQAVDRAVRKHGVDSVRRQSSLLAAALGVSSWEIERAVKLTRDGYIHSSRSFKHGDTTSGDLHHA